MRYSDLHWLVGSILVLLAAIAPVNAQEEGLYRFYYEQPTPNRLDFDLLRMNICLEEALLINGLDYDFVNVAYGDWLWLPQNPQACYQYDEERPYGWWNFSDNYPPRLKFYENGVWLDEPYYSDEVVYLGAESLQEIVTRYNVCEDVLLAHNILLQHFDRYKNYPIRSIDVFIPKDAPPCDPEWIPQEPENYHRDTKTYDFFEYAEAELTPLGFLEDHNICLESVASSWQNILYGAPSADRITVLAVPKDTPPCYNDSGQRLSYYDETGQPRDEAIYSDWPVIVTSPHISIEQVAEDYNVCLLNLLRVNNFPVFPVNVPVELFLPPSSECDDEGVYYERIKRNTNSLLNISLFYDICPEVLLDLNPHFRVMGDNWLLDNAYGNWQLEYWLILPDEKESCYEKVEDRTITSMFELERSLNICHQHLIYPYNTWLFNPYQRMSNLEIAAHIDVLYRHDTPPCYNDEGQRLHDVRFSAQPIAEQVAGIYPEYSPLPIHIFQRDDTVYAVSKRYNVCVPDILAENPVLQSRMPTGLPVFIPQTAPCYDDETGMPLLYTDENGAILTEPAVADQLIHYGGQQIGYVSHYYNVCVNRIEDANQQKLDRELGYLGLIIPTDRPHCYDQDGKPLHYVCYDSVLDLQVDYQRAGNAPSFSYEGTDCYDIFMPETVIWYANRPYKAIQYDGTLLESRAFTAWCYGVSLEAIDAINAEAAMLTLLPRNARMIPMPTRDCYLDHPEVLEGQPLYQVKTDETLYSIAQAHHKPYQWLAWVNDLNAENTIWTGQLLIIPSWRDLWVPFFGIFGIIGLGIMLYWVRRKKRNT